MPHSGIPESVRRFLIAHIDSLEQIEVLILLRGAADREWSAPDVSRELGSSVSSMQGRLEDLTSRGFLVARQGEAGALYRYAPSTDEARGLLDGLVRAYKERRLTVINLIYTKPESAAVSFADAFMIVRKKGDE